MKPPQTENEAPLVGQPKGSGVVEADPSGWQPHLNERRDFYHRIRLFPEDVARWRKSFLRHVAENPGRFPARVSQPENLQGLIDDAVVADVKTAGRDIDVRIEMLPCRPLGLASWRTTSDIRKITLVER